MILNRGILLLNKPETLESMRCVEKAKAITGAKKAGHSGTLDPKVTGLMLIAFNESTKAMPLLIGLRKRYTGVMAVHKEVKPAVLEDAARAFTGKITQMPPKRSAVARRLREREVFSFKITKIDGKNIHFDSEMDAGTYVRKICHDMGEHLGTGAHMASLHRTDIGPFNIKEAHTLEELKEKGESLLISLEDALERVGVRKIIIKDDAERLVRNGSPIHNELIAKPLPKMEVDDLAVIYTESGNLIGISMKKEEKVKTDRIFNL